MSRLHFNEFKGGAIVVPSNPAIPAKREQFDHIGPPSTDRQGATFCPYSQSEKSPMR
ncbi:MAG TPA: hypothetical protein VHE81_12980 [Lacipirellulaceae bacterium]|nr:hypothetical protein [Lacipirellulaceae bacterium]